MRAPFRYLLLFAAYCPMVATAQIAQPSEWARGALAQAQAASAALEDPYRKAQALAEIADAEVTLGDAPAARETLRQALAVAGSIEVEALRSWVLHDIAVAQ